MLIDFSSLQPSELKKPSYKKKKSIKNISSISNVESIDSKQVIKAIQNKFYNHKYQINNAYVFDWESDFFTVSESGYVYEIEVKVSKSDFFDDFNKKEKHILLESEEINTFRKKPNRFYYATPKNLLASHYIPAYAGLLEVDPVSREVTIVKEAPFLHKEKVIEDLKMILLDKFYFRYRELQKLED